MFVLYNKSFCVTLSCLPILSTNLAHEQYKNNTVAPDACSLGPPWSRSLSWLWLKGFTLPFCNCIRHIVVVITVIAVYLLFLQTSHHLKQALAKKKKLEWVLPHNAAPAALLACSPHYPLYMLSAKQGSCEYHF